MSVNKVQRLIAMRMIRVNEDYRDGKIDREEYIAIKAEYMALNALVISEGDK